MLSLFPARVNARRGQGAQGTRLAAHCCIALAVACLMLAGCCPSQSTRHCASPSRLAAASGEGITVHDFALYVSNRVLDVTDIVSFGVGFPLPRPQVRALGALHANLHVTRAVQFGRGVTGSKDEVDVPYLGKGHDRRFGWEATYREKSVFNLTTCRVAHYSKHDTFAETNWSTLSPKDEPFAKGNMDYYAVGTQLSIPFLSLVVDFHPVEVVDAIVGIFGVDLRHDDH